MAQINGIETMAKYKVKEGLDFGAWFTMYKQGWGGGNRHASHVVLGEYGGALEPYFEQMKSLSEPMHGARKKYAFEVLAEARKAPRPELISIKDSIRTKPDKAFLA